MADYRDLIVRIKGDTKDFNKSLGDTTEGSKKAETSLGKLTAAVGLGNLAYGAFNKTLSLATNFISGSFKAYEEQELATTRLQTGINNVKSATDKHIDSLIKEAQALQRTTRFSDEAYESAQGILSTFQLNQKAIEKLTPRLADMSEGLAKVSGEMPDMEGNAILVAKAIGGEDTAGLTGALRRAGVVMTKTQEELLKTGTVEQRVSLVTQVLDQNFKGMAESAGGTTAGKVAIFRNKLNDLQEKIGGLLAAGLNPLLDMLNKHESVLPIVTGAFASLLAIIVAAKVITATTVVLSALGGAVGFVGTAATVTTGAFTTMLAVMTNPIVLVAAGALADLALLYKAVTSVTGAFDAMNNAAQSARSEAKATQAAAQTMINSANAGTISLQQLYRSQQAVGGGLVYKQKVDGQDVYTTGYASGGYTGAGSDSQVAGVVHKGEYVIPKQDVDQSTGLPKSGGGNVNITVNMGMYAGMPVEKREIALSIYQELVRAARASGVRLPIIPSAGVQ